ncbi:MAG: Piwi domain-containing protein [Clostridiales bacterium]|nr:Piwi domain-containing protein [Clostridiales bacterium]
MESFLEIFKSNVPLQPREFHEYILAAKGDVSNFYQLSGKAVYGLTAQNKFKPVFRKDDTHLYSLEKLNVIPEIQGLKISYNGCKKIDIQGNNNVYADLVAYFINAKLKKIDSKYKIKYNKEIRNILMLENNKKYEELKRKYGINVYRVFDIMPEVFDNGDVHLRCNIRHEFESEKTIYDLLKERQNVIGLKVNYIWTNNTNSTGEIEDILDKKIDEKLDELKGQSLLEYYINNNQSYRINRFSEQDKKANVIKVKCNNKKPLYFIPHSLKQVIDRETLKMIDKDFSKSIDNHIKMDMGYRMKVLKDFIDDIGLIKELGNFKFDFESNDSKTLGFACEEIEKPIFLAENNTKISKKTDVFKKGYYLKPNKKVKFAIMWPKGYEDRAKKALRKIFSFNTLGYIKDNKEEKYFVSKKNLLDLEFANAAYEYKLGDITEYKRVAMNLKKQEKDIDLVLCVIPNEQYEDNPYSEFKKVWAKDNIPSQMICLDSIEAINDINDIKNIYLYNGLYYLNEVSLGILAKTGGIPWVLGNIPGNIDCFVGLDVGNPQKGIRYPSSSVVFDKNGTLINYFKPELPQTGEIIVENILQEIFDNIILSYENKFGGKPKHIVIHRDGFARENLEWYKKYFANNNIEFDVVEVKKQGASKFAIKERNEFKNPNAGMYVTNGKYAFLVTNDIKIGSPRPLKIEKVYGNTSLEDIVKQIYYLSELHIGSTKKTRLPITTEYADRISKNIMYIPSGTISEKLFFL